MGRRWLDLEAEITELDTYLISVINGSTPALVALQGVGPDVAGALLVAAGDNPDRLRSEASFAALCGVSPLDASSGRHQRHRLNRGGDREANCALFRIVLCRLIREERTRSYMARRLGEGKTKKEVIRCLKRHVAREVFTAIRQDLQAQEMKRSNSLSEAA